MARGSAHLKLVVSSLDAEVTEDGPSRGSVPEPMQLPLFHLPSPGFLGLVDMSRMQAAPFVNLLKELRPQWVMDLRVIPHFDLGGTNRSWFFELFRQLGIRYCDISGILDITTRKDASLNSGQATLAINSIIAREASAHRLGPILVLLDEPENLTVSERTLPSMLHPSPKDGWKAHRLDAKSMARPFLASLASSHLRAPNKNKG